MSHTKRWSVPDTEHWSQIANEIATTLKSGSILALKGPLGAGKTTFVQALTQAMGAKRVPKSPTFSMLRTYRVKQGSIHRLLHVDAYRIENETDLRPLDLDDELADGDAILVLEWPEHVATWLRSYPHRTLTIRIKEKGREAVLK